MKVAWICRIICLQIVTLGDRTIGLPLSEIAKIAEPITILINNSNKSQDTGVIIGHEGKQYTILTAAHVVCGKDYYHSCDCHSNYTLNIGNRRYTAKFNNIKLLSERVDLALIRFNSDRTCPVAKIGDSSQLAIGMTAFIAGFSVSTVAAIERLLWQVKSEAILRIIT